MYFTDVAELHKSAKIVNVIAERGSFYIKLVGGVDASLKMKKMPRW